MTQSIPRRHHYVPRFYLEYFAVRNKGSQPGFWIYDKKGGLPRQQTPLKTAVEKDLYTFTMPDGSKDLSLEIDLFSRVEGWTKPILDRLMRRPMLIPGDFENLTLFMTLLHVRVPRMIRATQEYTEKFTLEYWRNLGHDENEVERIWKLYGEGSGKKIWASKEEMRDQMVNFEKHFAIKGDEKFALALAIQQTEPIHREMMKLYPQLLATPKGNFFATSDSPVNVFVPTGDRTALFGAGFGLEAVEIFFPFTPNLGLFLSRRREHGLFRIDGHTAVEYNRRCVMMAERFVISPYESRRVSHNMKKFSGNYLKPRIDSAALVEKVKEIYRDGKVDKTTMKQGEP